VVEARAVVFPGDGRRELDHLLVVEVLAQRREHRLRHIHGVAVIATA